MNVSGPFIRRPIATSLLAAAVLLAGAAAFTQLPVAPLPRMDFPTISVNAALPGASPETMASAVATPLERRFGRIAGLAEMTSTSQLGSASITLQFDLDRDVDAAARDVQAAINAAQGDLPANLPFRPNYRKVNPSDSPILIVTLKSKTLPLATVFDQANTILAQKIAQTPGVGQVYVGGGQQPAVRVDAAPYALAGAHLGLPDVASSLQSLTANSPKGALQGDARAATVGANDQLLGAAPWRRSIVSYAQGGAVRLGDVAAVTDSVENERVAGWSMSERTVVVVIRRQPGANILEVIERVKALVPDLVKSMSPGIDVDLAMDRSQTIRASVDDVEHTLVIAVLLVTLVVFLFLRTARATFIPSVAVPLSLIGTFGVMYLAGYSLDNLSLMALTISTGFVVDDAIVVTENVARFIEEGMTPLQAALEGARQVGFTIVSITCSLLAVFIPILLMGGIVGRLFREFAWTLAIAITVSAIVSLTVTPTLCSRLLKPHAADEKEGPIARALERAFTALQGAYGRALDAILHHRTLVGIITLATVSLTVFLYIVIPKGLFPQQDNGLVIGFSDAPQDISFAAMKARQEQLNAILDKDPDVHRYVSFIGSGTGNTGMMFVQLNQRPPRRATADQVINRLRPQLARVVGVQLFLQAAQDLRVGGRFARTQYQYTLQDANLAELTDVAPRMLAAMRKLPELRDVNTDQQTAGLELDVKVDRDTLARLGLTMADVDAALYDAYGQAQVATTYTQYNAYRVVLEVAPGDARGPESLRSLYLRSPSGGMVPLASIATVAPRNVPLSVNHQSQFPSVTLSFNAAPGVALSQAVDAIHRTEARIGMPPAMHGAFSGTAQAFKESLSTEPWLIVAALIAVYIVLGMLYESLIHPITILSTLPSAGVGALVALLLFHVELNIIGLIGIVLLIGIVKKNAILMIDFALEAERVEGLEPTEAVRKACLLRFRPILMTTLAAAFGALPLALGHGTGSELRYPLGIAIVGGLALSQVLTLFTTPVTYLALDRFAKRNRR